MPPITAVPPSRTTSRVRASLVAIGAFCAPGTKLARWLPLPVAALLVARVLAHRGDLAGARAGLDEIRAELSKYPIKTMRK